MGNLWTVSQSTGNLTSSGTALFRGNVQTLGQFLGDGGALDNVVYDINNQEGSVDIVGAGTVSVFTSAGTITVSGTSSVGDITTVSGYLQGQIDAVEASDVDSINGALGALTLAGSDFINVSTVGQTITVSADAIVGGLNVTVVSGANTVTIHSSGGSGGASALIGADGITVVSGTPFTTISGFRSEFVAASGFLQTGIDNSLQNVVEDLTPQLGGDLDLNGFNIRSASTFDIEATGDGNQIDILAYGNGADIDLRVSDGVITLAATGTGGQISIVAEDEGQLSVDVAQANITATEGISLFGDVNLDGSHSFFTNNSPIDSNGTSMYIQTTGSGSSLHLFSLNEDGDVNIRAEDIVSLSGSVIRVVGGFQMTSPSTIAIPEPTHPTHAATKGYVDAATAGSKALVGADGITITSGTNTITVAGFRGEFVSASGFLQGQIDTANADVASLNGLQGALTLTGDSFINVTSAGSNISLTADAIVGAGTVSVLSGTNSVTVSGAAVVDKQFTAIGPVSQYDLVYITSSGNRVAAARADSTGTLEVIGMALAGASSGATVNVRLHGVVEGASGGAPVGVPLFLSSVTAGDFTDTPPTALGSFILQVGHAVNSNDIYVNVNTATAIENTVETVPVLSINSVSGTVTLVGAGQTSITTLGQTITVNTPVDKAIVTDGGFLTVSTGTSTISLSTDAITGTDGITVTSGASTVALTGFRTEFVAASGFIQTQINNLDSTYATDAQLTSVSGHLQTQITTFSDHGNLLGLGDDDHAQYFLSSATAESVRIVGGNDLFFQSDGSRGTPGATNTLAIEGSTGVLDSLGTMRFRSLTGTSRIDGHLVVGDLTVTGSQTIINTVTDVVNNLTVSGSATFGDPDSPFEDKVTVRGDMDLTLDASRSADTVLEITHQGSAGSWDIAGTGNLWHVTNQGNAFFQNLTVTGTVTGIDHGQLNGLGDDDHTQYILHNGTRAFTGNIQANASGTLDIGSSNTPFDEIFGSPVVREFVAVSGSPRRGMIAIDSNDQFVAYNGSSWIILG